MFKRTKDIFALFLLMFFLQDVHLILPLIGVKIILMLGLL